MGYCLSGEPDAERVSPNGWKSVVVGSFSALSECLGLSNSGLITTALALLKGFSRRNSAGYTVLVMTGLLSDFTLYVF